MAGIGLDIGLALALICCLGIVMVLLRDDLWASLGEMPRSTQTPAAPPGLLRRALWPARLIRQAGIQPAALLPFYWPGKIVSMLLAPLTLLEWAPAWSHGSLLVVVAAAGFWSLDLWLWRRRAQRRAQILHALKFFVDLLRAYLASGASLLHAFDYAARYGFRPTHPLAREAALVCAELEAGRSLRAALLAMEERTGVLEVRRLAAMLDVGTHVGAPLLDILGRQSQVLQNTQRDQIERLISRTSIALLFPLSLVSLPMFFVLVAFPAGVQVYETLQLLKQLL